MRRVRINTKFEAQIKKQRIRQQLHRMLMRRECECKKENTTKRSTNIKHNVAFVQLKEKNTIESTLARLDAEISHVITVTNFHKP